MTDLIETLKDLFFAITHPKFWIRNYRYSKEAEKVCQDILNDPEKSGLFIKAVLKQREKVITILAEFKPDLPDFRGVISLEKQELLPLEIITDRGRLWLSNYPYAFCSYLKDQRETLPKRRTQYRIGQMLENAHNLFPEYFI